MNTLTKLTVGLVLAMSFTLTACGDGGAKKSGLGSNELVGNLPAIYADNQLSLDAIRKKRDEAEAKAMQSGNSNKYAKAKEDYDKAYDKIEAEFKEASKAERAKINGKSIPFSMSDDFKKLKLEVVSVKVDAEKNNLAIVIHPTEDFKITGYSSNMLDYRYVNYKVLAKDGSVIKTDMVLITALMASQSKTFVKGEPVKLGRDGEEQKDLWGNLSVSSDPEKWVDFASIQFVGPKETK